jgi:pyrimidine-specific ribonucleoside hydrolase
MRNTKLFLLLIIALLLTGCLGNDLTPDPALIEPESPRPVIFDTDMAHEDMFAALFLLSHPNVDVRAITISGTGEAHCQPGVVNALGLVAVNEHKPIPVTCGLEAPLAGDHVFPEQWRRDADNAYGVTISEGGEKHPQAAPQLIADILQNSEEKISIVAVGPLTNIAAALQRAPEIAANIETIIIMGGAVDVPGNVGASGMGINNDFAEWNIYIDPTAANIVFNAGVPITLVPLDATSHVPVTRSFYRALGENRHTPAAELVYELLTANLDFVDSGGFQFWDSLTAAIFTENSLADFAEIPLRVVEQEGPESGRTTRVADGQVISVATSADRTHFEQLLLTILNWQE